MFDVLLKAVLFGPLVVLIGFTILEFFTGSRLPNLPLLNSRKGEWFAYYRTRFRNTTALKDALRLANAQYKNETVLLTVGGHHDLILLPNHETQWVMKQPDNILSRHAQTKEELAIDYGTYFDEKTFHESTPNQIINGKLNGQTGNLIPVVLEELNNHVSRVLGSDSKEYHDVCVYEAQQVVECQVSARVFSGLPFCRDPDLPKAAMGFIMSFLGSGVFLGFLPKPLKALAAPLVTLPTRKYERAFTRIVRPGIEKRLKEHQQRLASDPEKTALDPEPNDFLQWTINHAMKNGDPHFLKVKTLAGLQLLLNFASIHTSTFAITHAILDLASSKQEYIDQLREEVSTVLAEHGGTWSKQALSKMDKLDSTMRESQRLNMPSPIGVLRRVVAKDGVTTPSGVHLPKDSVIAVNAWAIHDDEKIYGADTDQFKPFRFAEKRADESIDYVERARHTWATTSAEYLAFGGGRSACPGRFFGAAKVKLMLAYILMNYDFEIQEKRPENVIFGLNVLPPMKATIRIKKRENAPVY